MTGERDRTRRLRVGAMISGGGRTLVNLHEHASDLGIVVPLVIASRECAGVERARARGLHVEVVPGRIPEAKLDEILKAHEIDLVCLAGYLQFVEIPAAWEGRVLNIHPALLPKHGGTGMYGDRVHRAVLDAGDAESGCTVHLCDGAYDQGRILVQKRCPVEPGDTVETLAARVFELECEAYPEAIRRIRAELQGSGASNLPMDDDRTP